MQPTTIRHCWLICCLIKMFVVLLLLLLLVLCPLYILANSNDKVNNNNNNDNTSAPSNGGFRTQNCNKLNENPNSQQEVPQSLSPPSSLSDYLKPSVVDTIDDAVVGSLADHNNLPKSRIAAGRDCGETNYAPANNSQHTNRKSIDSSVESEKRSRRGWRVNGGDNSENNSGDNSVRNISNRHVISEIRKKQSLQKSRNKRFIIFSGGGVVKLVIGVSFPIQLASKRRSLLHFYNLQMQYPPPGRPIYWWSLFNSSTFAARHQQQQGLIIDHKERLKQRLKHDVSREFVYTAIEQSYEQHGIPGESCLLQAICEVSRLPFYVPRIWQNNLGHLWHTLVNAILIPTVPNVAMKYLHASQAGRFGVDCQQTFSECPQRVNEWLRNVAHIE